MSKSSKKKNKSRAVKFKDLLDLHTYVNPDKVVTEYPFVLFMVLLAILYIGNIHFTERTIKDINALEKGYKELKWEYMSTKSELMYKSKQTNVSQMVEPMGLKELTTPPKKIVVKKD